MDSMDYKFDADEDTKHFAFFGVHLEGRQFTVDEAIRLREIYDRQDFMTAHQGDNMSLSNC